MQELKKSAEPYIFRSFRAELTDLHFFLGIVGSDYGLVSNIFYPFFWAFLFGIQYVTEILNTGFPFIVIPLYVYVPLINEVKNKTNNFRKF